MREEPNALWVDLIDLGSHVNRLKAWIVDGHGDKIADGFRMDDPPRFGFGPFDGEVFVRAVVVALADTETEPLFISKRGVMLYPGETLELPLVTSDCVWDSLDAK